MWGLSEPFAQQSNARSDKVNAVLQKRGCGWRSPGRFSALQMHSGIFSGHLCAWQKSQILVGNHALVLISSPCTLFSHRAGYKQYSLVIHGPHLGCALLHARAKLPFAKGEIPFLEKVSAATEGIKASVSTETLNTG